MGSKGQGPGDQGACQGELHDSSPVGRSEQKFNRRLWRMMTRMSVNFPPPVSDDPPSGSGQWLARPPPP
jgi:hypothetical protein